MIPAATPGPLQLQLTQQGCPGQAVTAVSRTRAQLRTRITLFVHRVLSKLLQCKIASVLMRSLWSTEKTTATAPRPRMSSTARPPLTRARPCRFKRSRCRKFDPHRPFSKRTFDLWSSERVSDTHSRSHMGV